MKVMKWLGVVAFLCVFVIPRTGYCQRSIKGIINDHEMRIGDLETAMEQVNDSIADHRDVLDSLREYIPAFVEMSDIIIANPCEEQDEFHDPNWCRYIPCANFTIEDSDNGERLCFNVLIRNIGYVATGPFKVLLKIKCCEGGLLIHLPYDVPSIGPHGYYILNECVELTSPCTVDSMEVIVDSANDVDEFRENNNECKQTFECLNFNID